MPLARYLERARGVVAHPEQIVICSGSADALATIARALAPGTIATEDPGLPYHYRGRHFFGRVPGPSAC